MTIQLAVVLVLVTAAGAYLLRTAWKTWAGGGNGCGSGCGKCKSPQVPTANGRRPLPTV